MNQITTCSFLALVVPFAIGMGCDAGESARASQQTPEAQNANPHGGEHSAEGHHEGESGVAGNEEEAEKTGGDQVDVPEKGKKFDPSITAEQLPKGVWHCDMNGKVHYAAKEKGDGECPICGMDLAQK